MVNVLSSLGETVDEEVVEVTLAVGKFLAELEEFKDDKNRPLLILPINENGDTQEFHVYKLQSAFESTRLSKTFHLHPRAVHEIADSTTGN